MLHLSGLFVYPVKSLGGVSLPAAQVTARGLRHDRRFMVVDETGRFLSQRRHPDMALLGVGIEPGGLLRLFSRKTGQSLPLPAEPPASPEAQTVHLWDDTVTAQLTSLRADAWLSDHLHTPCRLVYMPESTHRQADRRYAPAGQPVSFADGFPFLLISEASLADLNARLPEPVAMARFRPNLVVSGGTAFQEDTWRRFQAGPQRFRVVKPCGRCVMVNLDPHTAQSSREPLATLGTYRRQGNKVLFGQHLLAEGPPGEICVGQMLHLLPEA